MKTAAVIRKAIRQQRASLSTQEQQHAANAARQLARKQAWFKNAKTIAAYIPVGGELDPLPLVTQETSAQQELLLPVLRPVNRKKLWFAHWQAGDALRLNRYGIPEPYVDKHPLPTWTIDVILMPLVAFDRNGNRIGMGGGYYDRTLAFTKRLHHFSRPLLAGYAYSFQEVDNIEATAWDIPLDVVVTEKHVYKF